MFGFGLINFIKIHFKPMQIMRFPIFFSKNSFIYVLAILLMLSACSEKTENYENVFRYNEHKNIGSLDPAFAKDNADIWAVNQLFNGLVQMDENMNVIPCIATDWEISEDAMTYNI